MRIAVLSPPWFPVPPPRYGGIEWIVALLADGLAERGHEVTLFASGDSTTKAKLASVFPEAPSEFIGRSVYELHHALGCYERAGEFDVINDHSGALGAVLGAIVSTPAVHTVHGPLDRRSGELYQQIASVAPRVGFISVSMNQRAPQPDLPWVANCPNALDLSSYPVHPHRGDYLLFVGRMSPDKGCHRAIEVAQEAGLPLKIAGKMQERLEEEYFDAAVRPHLGPEIEFLGEVSHADKVDLLQNARVTLFPIKWQEPFGLVMIESMACGTPVIATRWGAVPEVIVDGKTGIIVGEHTEMVAAIEEADHIDPAACRRYVEEEFSAERMVRDYENAYASMLGGSGETSAVPQGRAGSPQGGVLGRARI
jgi:glycosyltransferase involved in cell wall biosynthesis